MATLLAWKPADLFLYAAPVFENYPKSNLIQNKLKPASLGTDWIENERFGQVFAKTSVFMPKTGSINSGTGLLKRSTNTGSGGPVR
jgi:5-keto 4-deoxyuronate isomerase